MSVTITESNVEEAALEILSDLGYKILYGPDIAPDGISPERQMNTIREHALDPLKGMLMVPEEEYSFLSSEAIKKGKRPEEFKREEFK